MRFLRVVGLLAAGACAARPAPPATAPAPPGTSPAPAATPPALPRTAQVMDESAVGIALPSAAVFDPEATQAATAAIPDPRVSVRIYTATEPFDTVVDTLTKGIRRAGSRRQYPEGEVNVEVVTFNIAHGPEPWMAAHVVIVERRTPPGKGEGKVAIRVQRKDWGGASVPLPTLPEPSPTPTTAGP